MTRAIAFILALSLFVFARAIGDESTGRYASMALGFVLVVATLVGEAGNRLGLPRITGYLVVGLLSGPAMLNLVTPAMASRLRLVNGLAVALIAFGAGMELEISALRKRWKQLAQHGGIVIGIVSAGLFAAMLLASPWIPQTAGLSLAECVAASLVLAAAMTSFSPTIVMAVLAETRARGPLTDRVLALVVAGDLAIVLLFTLSMTGARLLSGGDAHLASTVGHVAWELVGSPLVGLVAGLAVVAYRLLVDRRSGLVVAGMCLVFAEIGSRVGLSPLLTCLAAGLVVRNAAPDEAEAMHVLLEKVRLPVLVVFFAAAGATLRVHELWVLAPIVSGLFAVRTTLIVGSNRLARRVSGLDPHIARLVPAGLLPQAGVTVGLAVLIGESFPGWGPMLETLLVGVISLEQFIGPVIFRWSLEKAGEVPDDAAAKDQLVAVVQP